MCRLIFGGNVIPASSSSVHCCALKYVIHTLVFYIKCIVAQASYNVEGRGALGRLGGTAVLQCDRWLQKIPGANRWISGVLVSVQFGGCLIGGFPGGSQVSSERGSTYNIIFQFVSGKIVFSQVPKSIFEHPG